MALSIGQLAKQHTLAIGRAQQAKRRLTPGGHKPNCWPMVSTALGVHPDEVPEMQAILKEKGVKADFTKDGECILESPAHFKRVAEASGLFDRNGGYGSPQVQPIHYEMARARREQVAQMRREQQAFFRQLCRQR